jgi:glycosyltransferase involved in cell wall biosynthesis
VKDKCSILMYSGHCETVGGDARYFIDLLSRVNRGKFELTPLTDKNKMFEKRLSQWTEAGHVNVEYLNTAPTLFKEDQYRLLVSKVIKIFTLGRTNRVIDIVERLITKILKAITFKEIFDELKNAKVFKSKINEFENIDLFHFNNGGYPGKRAGITAMVVAKKMGINNTIMTIQNMPAGKKWYRLFDHLADYCIDKYCDYLICPSETLKEDIVKWRGINPQKIRVIHHGVDPIEPFKVNEGDEVKKNLNLSKDELILLIIGHLGEERKGHVELFKSLSAIKSEIPAYKLLVVGDGDRLNYLETMVKELGISENVKFLGYRQDLRELNLITDILLQPSTGFEGVPYSIRDAMRAGKPIIASSIGGIKEAVENNKNGYLLEAGNIEQLSESLLSLCKSKELRNRMGAVSEQMFMERFLLDGMVQSHEDLYLEMITSHN